MIRGVPYDHELEYIESTGSQWIDTGIKPKLTTKVRMKVYNKAWTGDVIFGFTPPSTVSSWDTKDWRIFNYSNTVYFDMLGGARINGSTFRAGEWRELEIGNYYVKDLVTGSTLISGTTRTDSSAYASNTYTLTLNKAGHNNSMSQNKWAYVKIYDGDTLVQDLTPVSVNGVAMMYDRVTGTFPKHYGTFVAGPVASTPLMGLHMYPQVYTAADYVQDGLVAIWDGIENAGWGRHHESPHLPVNLVDGQSLSINGDVEIGSNYFKFGAGEWGYSTIQNFASAVASKSFTVEIVAKNDKVANAGIVSIGSRGVWLYADSSNNIQTLNILSSTYTPSPSIQFKSSDLWHATIQGGVTPQIIVNGRTISAQYGTQTSVSSSVFYIGSLQGNASWSNGNMWCSSVRLYSRNLTASEIAANYTVDKERFKLS